MELAEPAEPEDVPDDLIDAGKAAKIALYSTRWLAELESQGVIKGYSHEGRSVRFYSESEIRRKLRPRPRPSAGE